MKTQTKAEIRNNTAKATKLLRGIDNEAIAITKDQAKLNKRVENVQKSVTQVASILGGISNMALAVPAAPKSAPAKAVPAKAAATKAVKLAAKATKKAEKAEKAAAAKAASKKAAQAEKAEKAASKKAAQAEKAASKKAAKAAAKAARPTAAAKVAKSVPSVKSGERPPLKLLINSVFDGLKNEWTPAAELYKQVMTKAGYFSRQSLYNALKDDKSYEKQGDGALAKFRRATDASTTSTKTTDEEADSFVEKSTSNLAAASAT
jgi:hypothetical protein